MELHSLDIKVSPTATHDVWDWDIINKTYRGAGTYILRDKNKEVLYVGIGGIGDKAKLGDRIEPHIRGWKRSYASSQLEMQHFIRFIEIYETGDDDEAKHIASILEAYFKLTYKPIFCKDSPSYTFPRINDYKKNNQLIKWDNWSPSEKHSLSTAKLI